MIESITYDAARGTKFPYAAQIEYFKKSPVTRFKPGLNIVYGANGSGKSTLLQLLGQSLAAVQGGRSVVTQAWLSDLLEFGSKAIGLPCDVVHDGQPIMYHDARSVVGLFGGSAAFDDDFFSEGIEACVAKGSVGQLSMQRGARLFNVLVADRKGATADGFPKEVEWKYPRTSTYADTAARIAAVEALFEARCAKGPKTLLFDEPESGFSMPWQAAMWRNIFARVDPAKFQVIVATHSPFALGIKDAHYVEMTPGYSEECLSVLMEDLTSKAAFIFGRPAPTAVPPKEAPQPAAPAKKARRTKKSADDKAAN